MLMYVVSCRRCIALQNYPGDVSCLLSAAGRSWLGSAALLNSGAEQRVEREICVTHFFPERLICTAGRIKADPEVTCGGTSEQRPGYLILGRSINAGKRFC